ncbi:MAG: hypothetical protein GXO50_03380 [Chlorobi bacterium]|nr:hypothetical protein [Chlorobiota bacterium]
MNRFFLTIILCFHVLFPNISFSQNENKKDYGEIHGNFEINMQTYAEDSLTGAEAVDDIIRTNAYANITYVKGNFSAGIRYEAYLNTMLGFDQRYNGQGIANRYVTYKTDEIEITAGNFYEQFGNGLILRTYEDKTLGTDNALDGFRIKYMPVKGIRITGLIGKQKLYWEYGPGIVRGTDAEISVNETFKKFEDKKTRIIIGGSFVSKYQKNLDPVYNFPENVGAFAGRINLSRNSFILASEYAYKINDPSSDNGNIFKDGNALLINTSWSKKGIGILANVLRLDNMSFRSDRAASINDLNINYLPAVAKTHTYAFAAMYPFATQPNGQVGGNVEIFYNMKRGSLLGGKYGMNISLNYSQVNSIKTEKIIVDPDAEIPDLDGYTSDFFAIGDELYFRDFNIEIHKKISKKLKFSAIYMYEDYNKLVIQGKYGTLHADIGILDFTYKFNSKNALRIENEILITGKEPSGEKQDYGDWYMFTLEYTSSPHWFFAVSDQYNYGNPDTQHRNHYYIISGGYTKGANRIQLGYGKQREGVTCVGGVCRNVPASNGFSLTVSTTF